MMCKLYHIDIQSKKLSLKKKIVSSLKLNFTNERNKLFIATLFLTFISKGVSFFVSIVSLPLTLNYLSNVEFVFVNTIISTLSVINYLDFGIGAGVQNFLPQYIAEKNEKKIAEVLSTAFLFLLIAAIIILIGGISAIYLFDLRFIFNLNSTFDRKIFNLTLVVPLVLIAAGLPMTLIQRVQIAYQKGYLNELFLTFGNLLLLISIYLTIKHKLQIPFVVFSLQGSLIIATAFNFFYYFVISKQYTIHFSTANKSFFISIFRIGLKYFLVMIFSVGLFALDNLLLMKYRSANEVAEYMVGYRLITLLNVPILIISNTFLPAYNDAVVRGDKMWIRVIILRFIRFILLITSFGTIIMLFFGKKLIKLWTSGSFNFSNYDIFLFICFFIFLNFSTFISVIATSKKYINLTVRFFIIAVSLTVVFKVFYIIFSTSGYQSIILPTIIIMPIFFLVPIFLKIYKGEISE